MSVHFMSLMYTSTQSLLYLLAYMTFLIKFITQSCGYWILDKTTTWILQKKEILIVESIHTEMESNKSLHSNKQLCKIGLKIWI